MAVNPFDLMKTDEGVIVISVILGLGLASMFRRVCSKGKCIIIKGPNAVEVESNVYRIKGSCYKYMTHVVECEGQGPTGTLDA